MHCNGSTNCTFSSYRILSRTSQTHADAELFRTSRRLFRRGRGNLIAMVADTVNRFIRNVDDMDSPGTVENNHSSCDLKTHLCVSFDVLVISGLRCHPITRSHGNPVLLFSLFQDKIEKGMFPFHVVVGNKDVGSRPPGSQQSMLELHDRSSEHVLAREEVSCLDCLDIGGQHPRTLCSTSGPP